MQPYLKKVILPSGRSMIYKEDHLENTKDWHYHPEIEIQLNVKGYGTKFIGDGVEPFGDNDLVLLGENLPHFWRKENKRKPTGRKNNKAHVIVIQFKRDFLGEGFYKAPEFVIIEDLLQRAKRGILFFGETQKRVQQLILELNKTPYLRILELLRILHVMAVSGEYRYLSSPDSVERFHNHDDDRINTIYDFTLARFRNRIRLAEVAGLVSMTETALSRYFKQRTQKKYSQFLMELRIGYACQQLIYSDKDIKRIGYESGYRSITNFHRQFRTIVGSTPVAYRSLYRKI